MGKYSEDAWTKIFHATPSCLGCLIGEEMVLHLPLGMSWRLTGSDSVPPLWFEDIDLIQLVLQTVLTLCM